MGFGHLSLDRKDVGQFTIKGIGPKMGSLAALISCTFTRTASPLFCTLLQDMGNAKLPGDLGKIARLALILLRGSARDHLQIGDLG